MSLTVEDAKKLREPFDESDIGKLPKPRKGVTDEGKCGICGKWHKDPGCFHANFVSHAHVTDRVLSVDPNYSFGPVMGADGHPIIRTGGREGIEVLYALTIKDTTRTEWGDAPNMKETSSDGFTRCAMRFGVGLDLWMKDSPATREEVKGQKKQQAPAPKEAASEAVGPAPADPSKPPPASQAQKNLITVRRKQLSALQADHPLLDRKIVSMDEATMLINDLDFAISEKTAELPPAASTLDEAITKDPQIIQDFDKVAE